jgi:hypothetical protein
MIVSLQKLKPKSATSGLLVRVYLRDVLTRLPALTAARWPSG